VKDFRPIGCICVLAGVITIFTDLLWGLIFILVGIIVYIGSNREIHQAAEKELAKQVQSPPITIQNATIPQQPVFQAQIDSPKISIYFPEINKKVEPVSNNIDSDYGICGVRLSPDNVHYAYFTGNQNIALRELSPGAPERILGTVPKREWHGSLLFTPDGRILLAGTTPHETPSTGSTIAWDTSTLSMLFQLKFPSKDMAFHPDGQHVLSCKKKDIAEWELSSGKILKEFKGHKDTVSTAIYSPDLSRVISSGHDGTVKIWRRDTGALERNIWGRAISLCVSADGKRLFASVTGAGYDRHLVGWDIDTGANVLRMDLESPRGSGGVGHIETIPESNLFAILAHELEEIYFIDMQSCTVRCTIYVETGATIDNYAISPDHRTLLLDITKTSKNIGAATRRSFISLIPMEFLSNVQGNA
jgi:hypothetical protein